MSRCIATLSRIERTRAKVARNVSSCPSRHGLESFAAKKEDFKAYRECRGRECSVNLRAERQVACKTFQDFKQSLKEVGDNKLLLSSARKLLCILRRTNVDMKVS
jgi:hypothetical protein